MNNLVTITLEEYKRLLEIKTKWSILRSLTRYEYSGEEHRKLLELEEPKDEV